MKTPEEVEQLLDTTQALQSELLADATDRVVAMRFSPGRAAATHVGLEFLRQTIDATAASGGRDEAVRGVVESLKDVAALLMLGSERVSGPVTIPGPRPSAGNRAQRRGRR